jgi:DNA-binding transcriptional LysR family regulator
MFPIMKEKLKSQMRDVTLRQLRALVTVARTGSISKAAEALSLTPPAISLQMRRLEEVAGLPLVERTAEGLRPTDAGQEILAATRHIEAALSECGEALDALKGGNRGKVSVGVVSTAKYFAPRALADFAKSYPNAEMRLQVGNRQETVAALRNYELDFAVMGRPPDDFEVEMSVIGDHPHIIVGPPDHPLAKRKEIPLASLAGETFLLREQGSGTRMLMQRLFLEAGLNPNIGMEIGSNETIKQAVMAGLGIALISAHTVSAEIRDGRLAALNVKGLPVIRQWFVVKREDKRLPPAAQALWEFLSSSGANYLPDMPMAKKRPARAS